MIIKNNLDKNRGFLSSLSSYKESKIVLIGAPMDFTVSFKPGTRSGPRKIREVSYGLEEYSIYLNETLEGKKFYDFGDLDLPFGNSLESLKIIASASKELIDDDKIPFFIGGEHLISLPVIQELRKKYSDLVVLHFDAHADLRNDYIGEKLSHSAVMRRVYESTKVKIFQYGIRSATKDEILFAQKHTHFYPFKVIEPLKQSMKMFSGKPLYVSFDIDVVDPAYAPGTGTPEPGGISSHEAIQVIHLLKDQKIVGMDIVEVLPAFDLSDRTALLAAKLIREAVIILSKS
ncbi:MAG: agmatinase [Thermosediminibacterales bacterium]|nr:agmatinase [Thermosediminibacterales bacterium]